MKPKVIGILLAGGKSRRMGENKLALFLGQLSIGSLSLKTALDSSLDHILVVTDEKDQLEWVDPLLFSPFYRSRWTQVKAKQTDLGQAYSLRAGLNKAETEEVYGAVVLLGDQPFLSLSLLEEVIIQSREAVGSANQYAAASFKDRIQPPIFLSRDLFPKLMKLQGDQGARAVLRHDPLIKGVVIENDKWENFYDIDTKEEYQWIKEVKSH